jgi:hypothetical protein
MARFTNPAGSVSNEVPFNLYDNNNDQLLEISKTGTGTTRIETIQDDLSLRSARDITLYAGSEGPGEVYIGWGDATYTPDSPNRVATVGYVDDAVDSATGLSGVVTQPWGYPTESSVAIRPELAGEGIALKSSQSTAIRWHVRENSPSVVIADLTPTAAVVTPTEGGYYVDFTINEQDYAPTTEQHYYNVDAPESTSYNGNFLPVSSTTTSLRLFYEADPGVFNATNAEIAQPSVYSQFEVNENGAYIKIANWTDGPGGYSQSWQFTKEGAIHFPYQQSNQRAGSGDVLKFAQSYDQAIITGPEATTANPTANRIVVAGQDGAAGESFDGEGGDIYLWAGRGGGANGGGGDIKIDAGNGATAGQGGYVKVRGGYSDNGNGGYINIDGGDSYTQNGGQINIRGGQNSTGTGGGGQVYIQGGYSADPTLGGAITITTFQSAPITISGAGGEFLNDPAVPGNQIATIGDTAKIPQTYYDATENYNLQATDAGKHIYMVNNYAIIVPTDSTLNFPIGTTIVLVSTDNNAGVVCEDSGTTSVWGAGYEETDAGSGWCITNRSMATLLKTGANEWMLSGATLTLGW